jgi:hypothetical protein
MTTLPQRFKLIECEQGSTEWLMARAGVITASVFKIARQWVGGLDERQQRYVDLVRAGTDKKLALLEAGYKVAPSSTTVQRALDGEKVGDFSDAAKDLAFRLACERISGEPMDELHQTWQMERGQNLEPDARRAHEIEAGVNVKRAGFVTTLDGVFGASADGLIADDEGSEYKCLVSPKGVRKIWLDDDISDFIDQIQGCLWLTGRKRWHFGMYCPALASVGKDLYWRVFDRDEDYIEQLQADLWRFAALVADYEKKLRLTAA